VRSSLKGTTQGRLTTPIPAKRVIGNHIQDHPELTDLGTSQTFRYYFQVARDLEGIVRQ
jgi:hypothetical protein